MPLHWHEALSAAQPFVLGAVLLLLYIAEHVYPQRRELIDYRHDLKNGLVGLFNGALIFGTGYLLQKFMEAYSDAGFGLLNRVAMPLALRFAISFLILDMMMYWWHLLNHRWYFLWRFHRFHHEDEKMNSTSALRFHFVELLLSYVWRLALFPLLGISVAGFAIYGLAFSAVVIFHHSGVRVHPRLDWVLRRGIVTPMMHRVHHSVRRVEADSNYGSVLPWWDWLFKTYTPPEGKEITFGVKQKQPLSTEQEA